MIEPNSGGADAEDDTDSENLQSEHCGPLFGPHCPSDPGIASVPRRRPQYNRPVSLERVMGTPEVFKGELPAAD